MCECEVFFFFVKGKKGSNFLRFMEFEMHFFEQIKNQAVLIFFFLAGCVKFVVKLKHLQNIHTVNTFVTKCLRISFDHLFFCI